jgi:hypothetical protein
MFLGAMDFKPTRTQRQPPGTDQLLNWAAYGVWEQQKSHVLCDKEVADKKQLTAAVQRAHNATAKGKERVRRYKRGAKGKASAKVIITNDEAAQPEESAGATGGMGEQPPTCRAAEGQRATDGLPWGGCWAGTELKGPKRRPLSGGIFSPTPGA